MQKTSIILVGLSYTGKSSVGKLIARRLGWPFKDTDDMVVSLAGGKPVAEIFSDWGEERFRGLERQALGLACSEPRAVISTGGGAGLDGGNRALMAGSGVVFWLDAHPGTIVARAQRSKGPARPLLQGSDALGQVEAMRQARLPHYSAVADWVISTDALDAEEIAEEILRNYGRLRGRLRTAATPVPLLEDRRRVPPQEGDRALPAATEGPGSHAGAMPATSTGAVAVVSTASGSYPVFMGAKALNTLPARLRNLGLRERVFLVSDENVARLYGRRVEDLLTQSGISAQSFSIPSGEGSKELGAVEALYDWLTAQRAERGQAIVALGGGVVGDLAGFVAATYLRGMPYIQVPTTLLAMVDAGIGGKTGVNRAAAKNLVGSFYQPRLVLADVELLGTLGQRELTEGWAEVVKHALIQDAQLLRVMEARVEDLKKLAAPVTAQVVAASAAIKATVVSQDERETGMRALLNYGHTIGHGIETAAGYGAFLHGEAVAVGMMGAAWLSQQMGLLSEEEVERQRALLERFGLPLRCRQVSPAAIKQAMGWDKKRRIGRQRWVLLEGLGNAVVRDDVPDEWVDGVLEDLAS